MEKQIWSQTKKKKKVKYTKTADTGTFLRQTIEMFEVKMRSFTLNHVEGRLKSH